MNCHTKRVTLFLSDGDPIVYQAKMSPLKPSPVLKACLGGRKKLECYGNLFAIDGEVRIDDQNLWIPVVSEYSDVFPEDLPGLPPDREIKFCIVLVPGAQPVSIPAYRMALAEMEELRE